MDTDKRRKAWCCVEGFEDSWFWCIAMQAKDWEIITTRRYKSRTTAYSGMMRVVKQLNLEDVSQGQLDE